MSVKHQEHIPTIRDHLMARIAALGRRVAPRDAVPSGKRRNAPRAARRATEGRVLFVVGRVARRWTWGHTTARRAPNRRQKSTRSNDRVWSEYALALLAGALVALAAMPANADPAAGEQAFSDNGCTECHYTEGPARETSIAEQLAKGGPELWYAGSKFQAEWLGAWLQDPQPIRPRAYNAPNEPNPGDHPALGADDAGSVNEFLMTLVSDAVEAGVIEPKRSAKGRNIFTKKMPCTGCHQFPTRKKFTGGVSGPSLIGAGSRLNPDWIYAYLTNPDLFKPFKAMPTFSGLLSEKDIKAVSAYVANFE